MSKIRQAQRAGFLTLGRPPSLSCRSWCVAWLARAHLMRAGALVRRAVATSSRRSALRFAGTSNFHEGGFSLFHRRSSSSSCTHSIAPEPGTIEERVVAALDALGAQYTLELCDEALSDTQQWCEAYGHTVTSSTSCITLASKGEPKQ